MSRTKPATRIAVVISLFIAIISCQQKINAPENFPNIPKSTTNFSSITLAVPDTIPAAVDEAALKKAQDLMCSGIRLLLIEPEKSFLVSFFEPINQEHSQEGIVENWVIKFDYKNNLIISETITSPEVGSLAKPLTYSVCWQLAEIFKDANYSGDSFTFTQETTTTGYYHKIIYNLAQSQSCCWYDYPGNLNDCLSSHRWSYRDEGTIYTMVPDNFKVWRDAQRSGPNHTFDANGSGCNRHCFDDNWTDETWLDGLVYVTINDKVSSIDMSYRVVDYTNCH